MSDAKKRTLQSLKTGAWERGFHLAKSYVGTGSRLLAQKVATSFLPKDERDNEMLQVFLKELGKITAHMGELKGSFQKVGQMLAMFGDQFLPPEAVRILSALHSESPRLDWKPILATLERELSPAQLSQLEIEQEAIGAASLGQVHRARLKATGELLAIKIQYPRVADATTSDLKILKRVLGLMNWIPRGPQMDSLFSEVEDMLRQELDYTKELAFFQRLNGYVKGDARYHVPKVYPEFSTSRVLTMSYESGLAADSDEVLSYSQEERNQIGKLWLELYLKEIFVWGFVQTDPHFGNYKIRREGDQLQLVLLDFGATRELENPFWQGYREMLSGTYQESLERVSQGAIIMGFLRQEDAPELRQIFYDLCRLVAEPFLLDRDFVFSESDLPRRAAGKAAEMVLKFKVRPPPRELVFLDRKMAGTFLFLSKLRCQFNPRPFVERAVAEYESSKIR